MSLSEILDISDKVKIIIVASRNEIILPQPALLVQCALMLLSTIWKLILIG